MPSIRQRGHNLQDYLPDFSYAGYHYGESSIPDITQYISVEEFGAKGDGRDDTDAFLRAIATDRNIYIPPGRYEINRIIRAKVAIKGDDPNNTILYFPRSLTDIKPDWKTFPKRKISNYSWSGGFIWIEGNFRSRFLASITSEAKRGDDSLVVSSSEELKIGQDIEIRLVRKNNSLIKYLYSGDPGRTDNWKDIEVSLVCRVIDIKGNTILINRPLRFGTRLEWVPGIYQFKPNVAEIGVENLCFEFPNKEYTGHLSELGFNALTLNNVSNCWLRNIKIMNADNGIFINKSKFCTIQNIIFDSDRHGKDGCVGHHGIYLQGDDNLFTDFKFNVRFVHDISVSNCAGNVCSDGKGIDLCFDHHKKAPYENLFTNIDVGLGSRVWESGGGEKLGRHCGARGTFWNIQSIKSQKLPRDFGPDSINLIAMQSKEFYPQNIYRFQLDKRLRR